MIEIAENGAQIDTEAHTLVQDAMQHAFDTEGAKGDATLMLTDEETIRTLNRDFRGVDAVTDVLTFPAWEGERVLCPPDGYIGDVAICVSRAREQAETYGHTFARELAFLVVHGALHLLGYDHIQPKDETVMLEKQEKILREMGQTR